MQLYWLFMFVEKLPYLNPFKMLYLLCRKLNWFGIELDFFKHNSSKFPAISFKKAHQQPRNSVHWIRLSHYSIRRLFMSYIAPILSKNNDRIFIFLSTFGCIGIVLLTAHLIGYIVHRRRQAVLTYRGRGVVYDNIKNVLCPIIQWSLSMFQT